MQKIVAYLVVLTYLPLALAKPVSAEGYTAPAYTYDSEYHTVQATQMAQVQHQPLEPPRSLMSGAPKVAVYVSEHTGYSDAEKSALRTAARATLVQSQRYQIVERSGVIETELAKQASGSVDDDELTRFGRQAGAAVICVVDMVLLRNRTVPVYEWRSRTESYRCGEQTCQRQVPYQQHIRDDHFEDHQVSARLIDVETAEVLALGLIEDPFKRGEGGTAITRAARAAVNEMLRSVQTPKGGNIPKYAVYVTEGSEDEDGRSQRRRGMRGGGSANVTNAFYTSALAALFARSNALGNFKVVERSEAFTSQIEREQLHQRSGHIDDSQIRRLGRQYGIQKILIAQVNQPRGEHQISLRLVNVELGTVENETMPERIAFTVGGGPVSGSGLGDIRRVSTIKIEQIFGLSAAEIRQRAEEDAIRRAELEHWAEQRRIQDEQRKILEARTARSNIILGIIGVGVLVGAIILMNATAKNENEKNRI